VQGGDLLLQSSATPASARRPLLHELRRDQRHALQGPHPITVDNFLHYANEAAWDGTFFHRSVPNFVIQGGGFIVDKNNTIQNAHQEASILNEPGITEHARPHRMRASTTTTPNTTDDINSATNQWFFNTVNNTSLDSSTAGSQASARSRTTRAWRWWMRSTGSSA
jgi:cyclophilin family peptidyl-prolyl cis-trans isomerase